MCISNYFRLILCAIALVLSLGSWAYSTLSIGAFLGTPGRILLFIDTDGSTPDATEVEVASYVLDAGRIVVEETFKAELAGEFNNTSGAARTCTARIKLDGVTQATQVVANCAANCATGWSWTKDWRQYATNTSISESTGWQMLTGSTWVWVGGTTTGLASVFNASGTWSVTLQGNGITAVCTNRSTRFIEN